MPLVTLDVAKMHLKVDEVDEDEGIAIYLGAAEATAVEFLNRQVFESEEAMAQAVAADKAGEAPMVVNAAIQAAILLILGHLYEHRSDVVAVRDIYELPRGSQSLLQPYRKSMGV